MKIKIIQQLLMLSKYAFIGMLCQCFLLSLVLASESNGQSSPKIKDVVVEVEFADEALLGVFKKLESITEYVFIFHANDEYLQDKFTLPKSKVSVEKLLLMISAQSGIDFRQFNNNISIKKLPAGKAAKIQTSLLVT